MTKKLITSLSIIALTAVIVIGGTIAYYNDTETSTGNIFTAGSIDLKVDHTYASYNGEECLGTCDVTGNDLIENGGFETPVPIGTWHVYPNGISGWAVINGAGIEIQRNSVAGAPHLGNQLVELDSHGAGSQSTMEQIIDTVPGQKYKFSFWHSPRPNNLPTDGSDNQIEFNVEVTSTSGSLVTDTIGETYSGSGTVWTEYVYNFIALDTETTIRFSDAGTQSDTLGGYLDDVSVYELDCEDFSYEYGGICTLWGERDLGGDGNDAFWNFSDVKPGDYGTNMISLHVYDNDAYVCLLPNNIEDNENGVMDPEVEAGDTTSNEGELSGELEFFIWSDENGNNTFESNEPILVDAGTPFNLIQTEIVQLSLTGNAPISIVGISWCAGEQTGPTDDDSNQSLSCDGNGMGNIAQTDQVIADFVAYAEQIRNNTGFNCQEINLGD